jgi:hypothetical protein
MDTETKTIDLDEVNVILSDALLQVSKRTMSPKRALVISRLALAISKNITNVELKQRLDTLEQILKNRN